MIHLNIFLSILYHTKELKEEKAIQKSKNQVSDANEATQIIVKLQKSSNKQTRSMFKTKDVPFEVSPK